MCQDRFWAWQVVCSCIHTHTNVEYLEQWAGPPHLLHSLCPYTNDICCLESGMTQEASVGGVIFGGGTACNVQLPPAHTLTVLRCNWKYSASTGIKSSSMCSSPPSPPSPPSVLYLTIICYFILLKNFLVGLKF